MKVTTTLVITILGCILGNAMETQAQTIHFSYDPAGNQEMRELICIGCRSARSTDATASDKFTRSSIKSEFHYYPNPVTDELHLKWTLADNQQVSSVALYAINGQHVRTFSNLEKQTEFKIPFFGYPNGVYSLMIRYNNGEKQAFTIIKK